MPISSWSKNQLIALLTDFLHPRFETLNNVNISQYGDSLFIGNNPYIIIPGLSSNNIHYFLPDTFGNVVDIMVETHSIEDAVKVAYRLSKRGDAVLLSPACASFDLFEDYEDRGRQFKNAVRNL